MIKWLPIYAEVRIQRKEVNNPCLSVVKGGCSAPIASLAVQLIWCGVVYPFLPSPLPSLKPITEEKGRRGEASLSYRVPLAEFHLY